MNRHFIIQQIPVNLSVLQSNERFVPVIHNWCSIINLIEILITYAWEIIQTQGLDKPQEALKVTNARNGICVPTPRIHSAVKCQTEVHQWKYLGDLTLHTEQLDNGALSTYTHISSIHTEFPLHFTLALETSSGGKVRFPWQQHAQVFALRQPRSLCQVQDTMALHTHTPFSLYDPWVSTAKQQAALAGSWLILFDRSVFVCVFWHRTVLNNAKNTPSFLMGKDGCQ